MIEMKETHTKTGKETERKRERKKEMSTMS